MEERRQRYIWTCLRGTPFEGQSGRFERFTGSLYEARRKAVLQFLKSLLPLLAILAATWDTEKYIKNVDFTGKSRQSQLQAAQRQEEQRGLVVFGPRAIEKCLRQGLFFHYANMCLWIERLPLQLASYAESCLCHEALVRNMSQFQKEKVMQLHCGQGITTCLAAGMMAPELVAGRLESVAEEAWTDIQASLLTLVSLPRAQAMTRDDWEALLADYRHGRSAVMAIFTLRVNFWRRLPWLLRCAAHANEDVARDCARRALSQFMVDPRQECHHRVTWEYLGPDSPTREAWDQFAAGSPRCSLPVGFLAALAVLRFVVTVETTIEAKHARVALERKSHHIGPVRVSLSNRLPLVERWLARGHIDIRDLVHHFGEARSLRRASALLGLECHPALLNFKLFKRGRASQFHPALTKVLYNCDVDSMYRSMKHGSGHDLKGKARAAARESRLTRERPKGPATFQEIARAAMKDHFSRRMDTAAAYSCPRSALHVHSLMHALDEPATKRRRRDGGHGPGETVPEILDGLPSAADGDTLYVLQAGLVQHWQEEGCEGACGHWRAHRPRSGADQHP